MILAIVGSTKFADDIPASLMAVKYIDDSLITYNPNLVVSGGAIGIDSLAAERARTQGIKVVEFLPENPRWMPNGYRKRNQQIADMYDVLICIRHSQSKTCGSGWTADEAERQGKPVERFMI